MVRGDGLQQERSCGTAQGGGEGRSMSVTLIGERRAQMKMGEYKIPAFEILGENFPPRGPKLKSPSLGPRPSPLRAHFDFCGGGDNAIKTGKAWAD